MTAPTSKLDNPYTSDHVLQYLRHIKFDINADSSSTIPSKHDVSTVDTGLPLLAKLQAHHLSTIPFENLALHYSSARHISLNPAAIFTKFIQRNRGGYCMEQNHFFSLMLRALGFTVYSVGGRVRFRSPKGVPTGDYKGWSHLVNIVAFNNGTRYLVDVGFGGDGPTRPLPLISGGQIIRKNLGTQDAMLSHENIASNHDASQRMWVYKVRNHADDPWKDIYCFTETEFLPQDCEIMQFWIDRSPRSFFSYNLLCVKMVLGRDDEIIGKIILVNAEVKKNMGSRTEVVKTCVTEDERVRVLRAEFGIDLDQSEIEGIRDLATALPDAGAR